MKPARILVAVNWAVCAEVTAALAGYEISDAITIEQAERHLAEEGIDLFVIGMHFDESRATEFVKTIRGDAGYAKAPIIVLRLLPTGRAKLWRQTFDAMKKMHTISDYLELQDDIQSAQKIRKAVEKCLPSEKEFSL